LSWWLLFQSAAGPHARHAHDRVGPEEAFEPIIEQMHLNRRQAAARFADGLILETSPVCDGLL
jgi:hypothetical protein